MEVHTYICYLDESGSPERGSNTPYFVFLGLALPASTWRAKDAEIAVILNRHNLFGELHTAWMIRRYPEQERIAGFREMDSAAREAAVLRERKIDLGKAALRGPAAVKNLAKNYAKTAAYIRMTHTQRVTFVREVADKLGSWHDAILFADAQLKTAHPVDSPAKVLEYSFEQVLTRFHHFLERSNAPVGILVQDHNDTAATRLTRLARRYYATGTKYAAVPRLVETPLFVDSQLTSMVQLADLSAYAVRRFFENGETDLFDRIYGRFDRAGKWLVGLRHFTGKNRCGCRVCKDHGRQ